MTVENTTQPSDKGATQPTGDTGADTNTQPSDKGTPPVSGADDSASKTYTQADIESAKRGLVKQQNELQQELEQAKAALAKHEEANLSELEKATRGREAAEELARQKDARIAEMTEEANRRDAATVLAGLKVENAGLVVAAIPPDILGDAEKVEQWAKDQNLIKPVGGNLPTGRQGTTGSNSGQKPRGNLFSTPYDHKHNR